MSNLVQVQNNQVIVSSRQIAEHFGKEHKNVLVSVKEILAAENSAAKFINIFIDFMSHNKYNKGVT